MKALLVAAIFVVLVLVGDLFADRRFLDLGLVLLAVALLCGNSALQHRTRKQIVTGARRRTPRS